MRSITRCISDCMCWISSYITARWSALTYSNWCNNSHILMYSICNCSRNSNTANVFSWNATATVESVMYRNTTRRSIGIFTCATAVICPLDLAQHHTPALGRIDPLVSRVCDQQSCESNAHNNGMIYVPSWPVCSSSACGYLTVKRHGVQTWV